MNVPTMHNRCQFAQNGDLAGDRLAAHPHCFIDSTNRDCTFHTAPEVSQVDTAKH